MPNGKYLFYPNSHPGDEDPAHPHSFEAGGDEEAIEKAKLLGRKGDSGTLYKKVASVEK